jgi:hypothetical protein
MRQRLEGPGVPTLHPQKARARAPCGFGRGRGSRNRSFQDATTGNMVADRNVRGLSVIVSKAND